MATTFVFEELDEATRDYLTAVRDAEGLGSPGVFVSTTDSLPGCGCIMGPIIIIVTLLLTLTTWLGVIYDDPVGVALLQTGGLLLGGWLLMTKFRTATGRKVAGTWVYADPLYLYQAFREQVTTTAIDDIDGANFTHNYNNGAYQNSVVRIESGGQMLAAVTLANEARAEQLVVYLNYLAWARGPEGGARANLAPATLGGLAKYVAKNDHEPLDAESNLNYNLIELDITEVPEEPTRAGRAVPALFPYIVMMGFAGLVFVVMAFVVNPPLRDDAIYEAVMKAPEPRMMRAYLMDSRNKNHREQVTNKLSSFYDNPIMHVKDKGGDPILKEGMAEILKSVRTADQPVVSIRVTEKGTPAGKEGAKATRESSLRTEFVNGVNGEFSKTFWGQPVPPPAGMTWTEPPPPIGQQLLAFIEAPEEAKAHFDIVYTVTTGDFDALKVAVEVTIRANVDDPNPTAQATLPIATTFSATDFDNSANLIAKIRDELVKAMVGQASGPGGPVAAPPGVGGIPMPGGAPRP